jgi:uncharacterized damage-inducible protein DinB
MPINELLLREFDQEISKTKTTLERVPTDKWDWRPHEKSGTLGWMAGHVASLPGFTTVVATGPAYDVGSGGPPKVEKGANLVELLNKTSGEARKALSAVTDQQLNDVWSLTMKGQTILSMPRYDALRSMCFNHLVHHRGQLTMYLRELGVPVPALYGPSADENPFL